MLLLLSFIVIYCYSLLFIVIIIIIIIVIIIIGIGINVVVFNVIVIAGDEVLIPAPYWVSYPEMVTLSGATSVIIQTKEEHGFKLTPEQLRDAITHRSR